MRQVWRTGAVAASWILVLLGIVQMAGCGFEQLEAKADAVETTPVPETEEQEQEQEEGCGHCVDAEASEGIARPEETRVEISSGRDQVNLPDVELVDQNGKKHRFYTDLVKGNLVLMNAIYTSCAGTCPMQTSIFAGVQRRIRDRVGDDVTMISVSLDPVTDTPERLKKFAETYQAGSGWYFLTGPPTDVKKVLQAMDLYTANPEEHTPIASVGNETTGVWMKVINLTSPDELVDKIEYVSKIKWSDVVER